MNAHAQLYQGREGHQAEDANISQYWQNHLLFQYLGAFQLSISRCFSISFQRNSQPENGGECHVVGEV